MSDYEIDERGFITSPGKFESEPRFVPHFWNQYLDGGADEDIAGVLLFEVTAEDVATFPELEQVHGVALEEMENGFVSCKCFETREAWEALIARLEDIPVDDGEEF